MARKTNTRAQADEPRLYQHVWHNKWLTAKAGSIEDMIGSLREAADELREMKARGVTLDQGGGAGDDYATLITDAPSVAQEFGFDGPDEDDDEVEDAAGSPRQTPAAHRYHLIANLDRREYFRMTSAWPVHLAVLKGELLPPGATHSLLGSWRGCTAEVVSSGKGPQSESLTEILALQAIAGNGGGTFYGEVRRSYRDVTGNLSWAVTRLPQARELCYRLMAAPADFSWLTVEEARRLLKGIATKAGGGFCTEFARWLASRPGLPRETQAALGSANPLRSLMS